MSWYEFLLLGHIIAAIIWLGAGFLLMLVIFGARGRGDRDAELAEQQGLEYLTPRLFIPASLSTLLFGLLLVIDSDFWSFDQLWVTIGLTGWLVSFVLGFFYFRPEGERIGSLVGDRGPTDPEVDRRLFNVTVVDRVQVLILFTVVADMVLKPTGDDEGLLIAGAVLIAAALVAAVLAIRGRGAAERPAV
jgi:uncharacterized membrane protein